MPVSPDSKANAIEEAFQCATPSTSECLESRNIYRKEQRTCDNEIISSAMKSSRSVRKMLLPMLTGDKLALCRCLRVPAGACRCLGLSRNHWYYTSRFNPRVNDATKQLAVEFYHWDYICTFYKIENDAPS